MNFVLHVFQQNCNPMYLTTVGFSYPVNVSTRIKVVVYEVKERLTNTVLDSLCFSITVLCFIWWHCLQDLFSYLKFAFGNRSICLISTGMILLNL